MAASRIPPSRRDPEFAAQRAAKVIGQQTPGAGRVAQAAPVLSSEVRAMLRGKAAGGGACCPVLHVGPSAPTDGSVFWKDTDETCGDPTSTTYTDTFNRSNETDLSVTDTGQTWTHYRSGRWGVSTNKAYLSTAHNAGSIAVIDAGTPDVTAECTISALDPSGDGGLAMRVEAVNNFFVFTVIDTGALVVLNCSAGSFSTITPSLSSTYTAGDVLKVTASGSTFTIYRNGVLNGTLTNADHAAGTLFGLWGESTAPPSPLRIEDFSVTATEPPNGNPLKVWDGSDWLTVGCLTPA